MKNLLQDLLIVFALALCGLLVFQWHREAKLRSQLSTLETAAREHQQTVETLRRDLQTASAEVARLEALCKQATNSSQEEFTRLTEQLAQAGAAQKQLTEEVESYKNALATANSNISRQNESLKQLTDEHNDLVTRYNQLVEDHNTLVDRWNEQQRQLQQPSR